MCIYEMCVCMLKSEDSPGKLILTFHSVFWDSLSGHEARTAHTFTRWTITPALQFLKPCLFFYFCWFKHEQKYWGLSVLPLCNAALLYTLPRCMCCPVYMLSLCTCIRKGSCSDISGSWSLVVLLRKISLLVFLSQDQPFFSCLHI